ncbi:hypothetical protein DFJ74DRAFT_607583 [Hyaloraphidium curvatum]|nr:hypothetical protein DFJ74DRAFT_607583 [Hyaloraphidium curvatum]
MATRSFAVVGGGISGLSVAWHLAHLAPDARIAVVEAAPRFGGWLHTVRVAAGRGRGVLFELGPRTLRPAGPPGVATLRLVHALGIAGDVVAVPKTAPAARNRFVFLDGRLERVGAPLFRRSALDIAKGLLAGHSPAPAAGLPAGFDDETIWAFFARRFGPRIADDLATSMVHGIYSGDARKLSLRSTFRSIFEVDRRMARAARSASRGRLLKAWALSRKDNAASEDPMFAERIGKEASIYTFKEGISHLSDAMVNDLRTRFPNVELRSGTDVVSIRLAPDGSVALETRTGPNGRSVSERFTHVTGAVASPALAAMLPGENGPERELRELLSSIVFSTVAVVNLAYVGSPEELLPVQGFGFLVPIRSMLGGGAEPPGGSLPALGVIFDSCAVEAQDDGVAVHGKPVTRLTVMLGGHAFESLFGDPDRADRGQILERAREVVRRSLFGGSEPELAASMVSVQKDCIPQYYLGHDHKLARMRELLGPGGEWGGKLSVCHASYTGVSMNDCVLNGRILATRLAVGDSDLFPGV